VTVLSVTPEATLAYQGYTRDIEVRVKNEGDLTETFNVTLYYGSYRIGDPQKVTDLAPGNTQILTWTWDTTGIPYGVYAISAVADQVPHETYTGNNVGSGGNIKMTIPGDADGNQIITISDMGEISDHWSSPPGVKPYEAYADIDNSGFVTITDMGICSDHWGQSW
jgi:hypothetical protein